MASEQSHIYHTSLLTSIKGQVSGGLSLYAKHISLRLLQNVDQACMCALQRLQHCSTVRPRWQPRNGQLLRPNPSLNPTPDRKSYNACPKVSPSTSITFKHGVEADTTHADARITKRPLLHPQIPSPYTNASQPKVIYIRPSTPFLSAVKRARKLLAQIEKRTLGLIDLVSSKDSDKEKMQRLGAQMSASRSQGKGRGKGKGKEKEKEEVLLKGTGRAIERVLELGLFFQGQDDVGVEVRTGTVGAVDDIEVDEEGEEEGEAERSKEGDGEQEVPEARVRMVSFVEVALTLE